MASFEWWVPIPWVLAALSVTVAVIAFRRSRHPAMKIHRMATECLGRHPDWDYHEYFYLDLLCLGTDVFDLEVYLECDHSYREHGRRNSLVRRFQFKPLGALPNPIKNGQVVRFELGDHDFRDLRGRRTFDPRLPSELWPGRVRIAAYHSGRRLLLALSSWRFRRLLRSFDSLCVEGHPLGHKKQPQPEDKAMPNKPLHPTLGSGASRRSSVG